MKKKKIYTKLRYMRERFGYSQEYFANKIGCGTANYANKERGRVPWSLDECFILKDCINKHLTAIGEPVETVDTLFHAELVDKKITKSLSSSKKKAV